MKALQRLLQIALPAASIPAGYKVSGTFDTNTDTAVRNYQRAKNLKVDGIVGRFTLAALEGRPAPAASGSAGKEVYRPTTFSLADVRAGKATFVRGQSGPGVAAMQTLLKNSVSRDLKIDGLFGPLTEAAVKTAQQSANLPVTGRFDQATLAALESAGASAVAGGSSNTLLIVGAGALALLLLVGGAKAKRRSTAAV